MKSIYVNRDSYGKKSKRYVWVLALLVSLAFMLLCLRVVAPYALEVWVNNKGSDNKGFSYRIGDIDLHVLKGEVLLKDFELFHHASKLNLAEASEVYVYLSLRNLFSNAKSFEVKADKVDVLLSSEFLEELDKFGQDAKQKNLVPFSLEHVEALIATVNIRQLKENTTKTILSLTQSRVDLRDLMPGRLGPNSHFSIQSKLAEGGDFQLRGKTLQEKGNTPWTIEGKILSIPPSVIEKLAGIELPFEIKEKSLNASIAATTSDGQIEGVIRPEISELRIKDEKKEGTRERRGLAKASTFVFDKSSESPDTQELEIPFTLKENLSLNFQEAIDNLRRKNL